MPFVQLLLCTTVIIIGYAKSIEQPPKQGVNGCRSAGSYARPLLSRATPSKTVPRLVTRAWPSALCTQPLYIDINACSVWIADENIQLLKSPLCAFGGSGVRNWRKAWRSSPRCIQRLLLIENKDGRPEEDLLVVHRFCTCGD